MDVCENVATSTCIGECLRHVGDQLAIERYISFHRTARYWINQFLNGQRAIRVNKSLHARK